MLNWALDLKASLLHLRAPSSHYPSPSKADQARDAANSSKSLACPLCMPLAIPHFPWLGSLALSYGQKTAKSNQCIGPLLLPTAALVDDVKCGDARNLNEPNGWPKSIRNPLPRTTSTGRYTPTGLKGLVWNRTWHFGHIIKSACTSATLQPQ
jgi:hypothetical protein